MTFRIVRTVDTDLDRIVPRLESARPGLGLRLVRELFEATNAIESNPWLFSAVDDPPVASGEFREALILRATYRVVYRIHGDDIVVLAIRQTSQRPGSWHSSLTEE